MDYLRAVMRSNELSVRSLNLTTDAILLNPSNYTVWHFRRQVIDALSIDLSAEMDFVALVTRDHIKTYQAWYHRRAIVSRIGQGQTELAFTASILQQDAKNYHAWQHRQWAIQQYNIFDSLHDDGFPYVEHLLSNDIRNNSAWSHRFFLVKHTSGFKLEAKQAEIDYAIGKIKLVPNNESAWNFLEGIVEAEAGLFATFPQVKETSLAIASEAPPPRFALATLVKIHTQEFANSGSVSSRDAAIQTCKQLASIDEIRRKYWLHRIALISKS